MCKFHSVRMSKNDIEFVIGKTFENHTDIEVIERIENMFKPSSVTFKVEPDLLVVKVHGNELQPRFIF